MNRQFLSLLILVFGVVSCTRTGIPDGSFLLRASEVFRSDTELVAKLTIETTTPTHYLLESKSSGGGGRGGGTTRERRDSSGILCSQELWLIASYVSYSNAEDDYVKVEVRHLPVNSVSVAKLPHSTPKESIQLLVKDGIHTMNCGKPYLLAKIGDEEYFLTVGTTTNDLVQQVE